MRTCSAFVRWLLAAVCLFAGTRILIAAAPVVLPAGALPAAQQVDVAAVVNRFFPQEMLDARAQSPDPHPPDMRSCHAVYDRTPHGQPRTIVAGYSDFYIAALRVIGPAAGGHAVAAQPSSDLWMTGTDCAVELIDLDGDNVAEIHLELPSMRGVTTSHWIFRWNGTTLTNLTPVSSDLGRAISLLTNVSFVDTRHDGTLQVYSVGQYPRPADPATAVPDQIFRLTPAGFVADVATLELAIFTRETGQPTTETRTFARIDGITGPYVLRVVNGDRGGAHRVSSGRISLNGAEIVGPDRFGPDVEFIEVPVTPAVANELTVRLAGAPGSSILVTVQGRLKH